MTDDAVSRATDIVARTFGNTMSPVVTALMTAAGAVTGNIDLAAWAIPTGAAVGVLSEDLFRNARRAWAAEGVAQFVDEVEAKTGVPMEETLASVGADRSKGKLMGEAVEGAAESADGWKVRMLARAFVLGARDGSRVDEMRLLVQWLRKVETVDARALAAIVRLSQDQEKHLKSYGERFGEKTHPSRYQLLAFADPGLASVAELLCAKLEELGYIRFGESSYFFDVTPTGKAIARLLKAVDSSSESADSAIRTR